MSEYKRWVSYVYYYENGNKKNNIGYIRVETRGELTKITVHINVLSVTEPMKVFLYIRNDNLMEGKCIGDVNMNKGVGEASFTVNTKSFNEMGGIIIYYSNDKFFGSEWDDNPIDINNFVSSEIQENELSDEVVIEEIRVDVRDEGRQDEIMQEESEDISNNEDVEVNEDIKTNKYIETNESKVEQIDVEEIEQSEFGKFEVNESESVPVDVVVEEKAERIYSDIEKAAERMLKTYPQMYPFQDDEMKMCVRIEPQDIGQLPIDAWILANNSFLLHGYYSYRHLMLMKTSDKMHPKYLIGVPGIYHNRDEFIAKMFGFELFKPMRNVNDVKGEFGYWCILATDISEPKKYI